MGHPAKSQNKFILVKIVLKTVLNQLWNDAPPSYPIQQSAKNSLATPVSLWGCCSNTTTEKR